MHKNKIFWSWAFYDWANSAFSSVIETFVFATYFVSHVAADKTEGASLWGLALGLSGLSVAMLGPFLGALADRGGQRKEWMAFFTCIVILCTALMWFVKPSSDDVFFALALIGISTAASELAYIFYNAMLPDLAGEGNMGRWSGWGWGLGYAGGMLALIICLLLFIHSGSDDQDVRNTFLFTAGWYAAFSLPLFLWCPVEKGPRIPWQTALQQGLIQLKQTFFEVRKYTNLFKFFIARMIFMDALITLFAFGGVYAAAQFNMDERQILLFGIGLNVMAGLGAWLFAILDDLLGGRQIILYALAGLILAGSAALAVHAAHQFWIFGMLTGLFVGPVQASSRSYLARKAPRELSNQMFGFFAVSSKVTSFAGPLLISWVTAMTGSLRLGMSTIILMLLMGFVLMLLTEKDK